MTKYFMTDDWVRRVQDQPLTVLYGSELITVRRSSRRALVRPATWLEAELEVVRDEQVIALIARESEDVRGFWLPELFADTLGMLARELGDGLRRFLG